MSEESATSKPFRVTVATPSIGFPRIQYTYSLANMLLYFSQARVFDDCDEQSIFYRVREGAGISSNREQLVRSFLETDHSHLLWVDEDMGFDPDIIHVLARHKQPIVGCNYPMRVPGAGYTALNEAGDARIVTDAASSGLVSATYMGFGMCLIAREVFESFGEDALFPLGYIPETKTYATEEFIFFKECRKKGFIPWVSQDASKKVIHQGNFSYSWKDQWG